MTRTRRWSLPAVLASLAIAVSACGTSTASPSTAPSSAAPASATPAASSSGGASAPSVYPVSGEAPCGQKEAPDATHKKYAGNFKKISAPDAKTVVFDLCSPDVAFLAKIAFSSFAINDSDYLAKTAADGSIVTKPNGTGPYMLQEFVKGDHITMVANPNYTGDKPAKAPTLIINWSKEAAQRLVELQSGTVDGIDNVGPDDFDTIKADPNLQLIPRPAPQRLLHRDEQRLQAVRQRAGPPGDGHGHRPPAHRRQLLPGRVRGRQVLHPVRHPGGCEGDAWYEFDPDEGQGDARRGGLPDGFKTTLQLPRRRPRLPAQPDTGRHGHPGAAEDQPEHRRRDRHPGIHRPTSTTPTPASSTASTCSAGVPTTRTSRTSSTSTSVPAPRSSSATHFPDIEAALKRAPRRPIRRAGTPRTPRPTSSSRSTSR